MAIHHTVNHASSQAWTESLFIKKQTAVAAGWSVPSSSNGTVYNPAGDEWLAPADAAAANAWCILRDPAGARELLLRHQNSANGDDWYQGYSRQAKFILGTPGVAQPPQAADEVALWGTLAGQATADMFGSSSQAQIIHCVFESTPINGVYPFWMYSHLAGSPNVGYFAECCEPILTNSQQGDADPSMWGIGGSTSVAPNLFAETSLGLATYSGIWRSWFNAGLPDEEWAGYVGSSGGWAGVAGRDPRNGAVQGYPLTWGRSNSQPTAIAMKGMGGWLKWASDTRARFETVNLNLGAHIHMGNCLLPWPDGIEPSLT